MLPVANKGALNGGRTTAPSVFLAGPGVFLCSFLVYLFTTCPTVYLGDSGEFIASAFCLGNPHNSGYPLYALMGKLFCLIPLGTVAFRLNLMSAVFGALTAYLTYHLVVQLTRSRIAGWTAGLLLAFSATLWSQTTCAEVYTLHAFFVALILVLLFRWHDNQGLGRLLVFAFVVGLSFTNHMQTAMLAPAVFLFIVWSNRKILFDLRHCLLLAFFFILGLSVYLYLPIRTEAGAAIHWGDPNTLSRFFHHVGAGDHRHAYVFTKSWNAYVSRTLEVLADTWRQYSFFWLLALLGWYQQKGLKWKLFWFLLFLFDLIYSVFLNIVSLEITAFQIPSAIFGAVLIGLGLHAVLRWSPASDHARPSWRRWLQTAALCVPVLPLSMNLYQNDQHANYTAYEFGTNVLRSAPAHATLLVEGDNIVFPVAYLSLVENARPDLALYDRHNLFFKMPFLYREGPTFYGKWEELRRIIEDELVTSRNDVFIAVFNEKGLSDRGFDLIPHGVISRAVPSEKFESVFEETTNPWPYYAAESFDGTFYRDYMNRTVTGYYFFKMARDLIFRSQDALAAGIMQKASSVAYNDHTLHGDIAAFYIDIGMLDEAGKALDVFSKNTTDRARLHNMWGYYYSKTGDVDSAIARFHKALDAKPSLYDAHRNLGLMFLEKGELDRAREAFEQSLSLNPKQPNLISFMKERGL